MDDRGLRAETVGGHTHEVSCNRRLELADHIVVKSASIFKQWILNLP